jgi:O-antigen/teichoic acid export membrane protein
VVFPIAGGILVLAPELTGVLFGEKWLPMIPALQILCLLGPLRCFQWSQIFMSMGRPGIETRITVIRLLTMIITIYPLTTKYGIAGTSLSVLIAALVVQPMGFYELQKLIDVRIKDILKLFSFPVTATLIMMLCVFVTKSTIGEVGLISLFFLVCLGAVSYAFCIFLMSKVSTKYDAIALLRDIMKGAR